MTHVWLMVSASFRAPPKIFLFFNVHAPKIICFVQYKFISSFLNHLFVRYYIDESAYLSIKVLTQGLLQSE